MKLRNQLLCMLPLLIVLVGCGEEEVWIVRKPQWNYTAYDRIAVVPITTESPAADAEASKMTTILTDLLAQNGTFTVVSRQELAAVMKEQDLAATDLADPSTSLPSGMISVAQALVVGRITEYATDQRREQTSIPDVRINSRGIPYVAGTKTVWRFKHEARVGGSVRVVDAATGEVVFAHSVPTIVAEDSATEKSPKMSVGELADQAATRLATTFYAQLAPVRTQVELDKDMFIVATDYYDGEYTEPKRLSPALDQFMVVVRNFPNACDGNSFRIAVTVKEGRQDLFSEEFVWAAGMGVRGLQFPVPMSALTATGASEFTAKLYAGSEAPAMTRDFELETK